MLMTPSVSYKCINSMFDEALLQEDSVSLSKWANDLHLEFNSDKCYLMKFSNSTLSFETAYFLDDICIQSKISYCHRDLE